MEHYVPADQLSGKTLEELQDDLTLNEVMRDSLVEDDPQERRKLDAQIKEIRNRIHQMKRASQQDSSRPASRTISRSADRRLPSRPQKRTYTGGLSSDIPHQPSKSRRTTPTPVGDHFSSPLSTPSSGVVGFNISSPIDLTGDNDELSWREQQIEREKRFADRRNQEQADAEMARRLQQRGAASDSSESVAYQDLSSEPTAFDLMSQSYRSPNRSAVQSSANGTRHLDAGSAARPSFGSPSVIQDSRQSHNNSPSNSSFAQYGSMESPWQPAFNGGLGAPSGASTSYRMPGAFDNDFEDFMSGTPHQATSYRMPSHHGFTPASSFAGPAPPGELARQAALQRQRQMEMGISPQGFPHQNFTPLYNNPWGNGAYAAPILGPRPGMLNNGSADPFRMERPDSGSLSSIINRAARYDFTNGLDENGQPLPAWMQDFANDIMDDPRNNEEQIKELLASIRPDMDIPEEDRGDDPEDLRYPLYKHQRIALTWMKMMEEDKKKKGGILADDMGLGKTISTLALLVSRKAQPTEGQRIPKAKTTLIVGPLALVRQWEREIQKKLKARFALSVTLHHGKKQSFNDLRVYDVVLTTYGTLASEVTKRDKFLRDHPGMPNEQIEQHLQKHCPLISSKSLWHRVVLDEAQCIKNHKTKTAKAACALQAEYRWCLSGTPMMNGPFELASLIHFLRIKPYCDLNRFRADFGCINAARATGNRPEAMRKLQAVLKAIMLRRTKSSELDGKPIIELPPKVENVVHVEFDPGERQYYEDLEKDSQVKASKFFHDGATGKKYQVILTLLLRLRQACCHPYLHITDLESGGSGEVTEDQMMTLAKEMAGDVIKRIKEAEGFECPICFDAAENPTILLPCGHDICTECFAQYSSDAVQRNIQAGDENNASVSCPECRALIEVSKVITYEAFKKVHMPAPAEHSANGSVEDGQEAFSDSSDDESESDEDYGDDVDQNGNLAGFIVADESDGDTGGKAGADKGKHVAVDDESAESEFEDVSEIFSKAKSAGPVKRKKKSKSKSKAKGKQKEDPVKPHMLKKLRQEASKNKDARKRYMNYLRKIWQPSAKVNACSDLIRDIQDSGEKTIVFSQWTLLLDLLELPLKHELKVGYRRYDGSMSALARDNAARDFMEDRNVKVMLVSLKAGNAGLNLTAASQIIIMDPFWNPFIENQAVDRAHRIGQQKEVKVHRILVRGTVEDRIVALQNKKRELVEAALSEEAAKNIGSLGRRELRYLFGLGGL